MKPILLVFCQLGIRLHKSLEKLRQCRSMAFLFTLNFVSQMIEISTYFSVEGRLWAMEHM
jgi:hypothetical protein